MSNYDRLGKKNHKFMSNTSRDIICYFSTVASENSVDAVEICDQNYVFETIYLLYYLFS